MWRKARFHPLLFTVVALCFTASAQDSPQALPTHNFWDLPNKALFVSHAGLEAVDFGITHRNLNHGGIETDSVAKPFFELGTPGQVIFFAGRSVGVVGVSHLLHRTGHHKLERIFPVYASGDSAYGVAYSFAHR